MRLRPMTSADAGAVARLSAQLGYPLPAAVLQERIACIAGLADHALFVAEAEDGALLGWLHVHGAHLLESAASYAEIAGLVVDEAARGRGFGRALVLAAEQWAVEQGYPDIRVRAADRRAAAHAFYRHLGYDYVKTQLRFRKPLG